MFSIFNFTLGFSLWYLLPLFGLISVVVAFLTYRNLGLSPRWKWALFLLRGSGIFFLLSLFLEPRIERDTRIEPLPRIAIGIDHSESMTIADELNGGLIRRDSLVRQGLSRLGAMAKSEVSYYLYGSLPRQIGRDSLMGSLGFNDPETDLSVFLSSLRGSELNAVILLSDGRITAGEQSGSLGESQPFPIFSVLYGSRDVRRDIAIQRVIAPKRVMSGVEIPITVLLSSSGYNGQRVRLFLDANGERIVNTDITLDGLDQSVSLRMVPQYDLSTEGDLVLRAGITPLEGEFSTRNNVYPFTMKVEKSKRRVLVIAGLADAEIGAVRNTLMSEKDIEAVFYTQKNPTAFNEGIFSPEQLGEIDACLLIGFPNGTVSESLNSDVLKVLGAGSFPIFMMLSFQTTGRELLRYDPFMAVRNGRVVFGEAIESGAFLTMAEGGERFEGWGDWGNRLGVVLPATPPLGYLDYDFKVKQGTEVIWKLYLNNRLTDKLAFAVLRAGERKFATLCTPQFWRLRLSPEAQVRELYRQTLLGTLRWMMTTTTSERFTVSLSSPTQEFGLPVFFSATLQDAMLRPERDAEIRLRLYGTQSRLPIEVYFDADVTAGAYRLRLDGLPADRYRYEATAYYGLSKKDSLMTKGTLQVIQTGREFRNPTADEEGMRELAERSGGHFFYYSELDSLIDMIERAPHLRPTSYNETTRTDLTAAPMILFLVIGLFSIEWVIRKRVSLP